MSYMGKVAQLTMNENSTQKIINFINVMFDDQISDPVKFVMKRKFKN